VTFTEEIPKPTGEKNVARDGFTLAVRRTSSTVSAKIGNFAQNTHTRNPQNRRIVLSPIPIDGESRAVSKKVLTLDEAQKAKKLC